MTKWSEDEKIARAMLLGYSYKAYANMYVKDEKLPVGDEVWLDADTLEQIPQEDKLERLTSSIKYPNV